MRQALNNAQKILSGKSNLICAEIGVLRGENSLEILTQWNEVKRLYLIEDFKEGNEYDGACKRLLDYKEKIEWVMKSSKEAAKCFDDNFFDFIYLDAGHGYDSVKEDIESWHPKLKNGGVLCGHDYNPRWPSLEGVIRAVKEYANNNSLMLYTDVLGSNSDWWWVK